MRTTSYDFENEDAVFKVLVNHEEQYSLWPADLPVPGGWKETGQQGPKSECDDYINRVWTDMRPKSLREWMDGEGKDDGERSMVEAASVLSESSGTKDSSK